MITVIIPVVLLLAIILIKKIPYIGGSIIAGLFVCGMTALLMGGIYNPVIWLKAFVTGLDRLAWVMALAIFGSIYAETQIELGTMKTVLNSLRAKFGRSPKGLVSVIIVTLTLSGSLLGESIASATIIGILVVNALAELKMSGEQISATIVMGACMGSIAPPITQAVFLSSSLLGMESPDPAVNIAYFTIGIAMILVCIFVSKVFVKVDSIPEELIPEKSAGQILSEGWKSLIPLMVLIIIIVLRSGFKIELLDLLNPIFNPIKDIPVLRGINYAVVKAIIVATVVAYFFKDVRSKGLKIIKDGCYNVRKSLSVQALAAFMVGCFFTAGQIETVQRFTESLTANVLKIGGGLSMALVGMLSGSQTTTQVSIFTFFGPALEKAGVKTVNAAVAGAHLAMAGQGMPPADVVTFVVAGMVAGLIGKKVDPIKSMGYSMFLCGYFLLVGFIFMFI